MSEERTTPSRGVPVQLDRTRYLRFSLATIRKIRNEFGDDSIKKGISEDKLAKMLWYGFVEDDPTITPEFIEDFIDLENLPLVMEAVTKAYGGKARAEARPRLEVVETDPPPPSSAAREGTEEA